VYGPLVWSEDEDSWTGSFSFNDRDVRLVLLVDDPSEIPEGSEVMLRALRGRLSSLVQEAASWVCSDLSDWLDEPDRGDVTAIANQMTVADVHIGGSDGASVFFDGPNAIRDSGHAVEARLDEGALLYSFVLVG
jgi:hypothetical protein